MDWKLYVTVLGTVLLAEMGDKTQLATALYAADPAKSRWTIFAGAATGLVVSAALAIALGALLGRFVPQQALRWAAGLGFVAVGVWTIARG